MANLGVGLGSGVVLYCYGFAAVVATEPSMNLVDMLIVNAAGPILKLASTLGTGHASRGNSSSRQTQMDSISDQWIDFLLKQAQAAGAEADESPASLGQELRPNSAASQAAGGVSHAGGKCFTFVPSPGPHVNSCTCCDS